jgi:hypothetical protein
MSRTYTDITRLSSYPVPAASRTYCPVSQERLWNTVCGQFESAGLRVVSDSHQVHRKQPVFVSKAVITSPDLPDSPGETWEFAVMNSYNMTIAARVMFGKTVTVCTNGLIMAEHILRTKHTTNVWDRLPVMIDNAVKSFVAQSRQYTERQERLKTQYTGSTELAQFALQLAQRGVLNKSKILDFYEESKSPSFDYQTEYLCLWNLQAAFTHLVKEANPVDRPRAVIEFDRNLDQFYALA